VSAKRIRDFIEHNLKLTGPDGKFNDLTPPEMCFAWSQLIHAINTIVAIASTLKAMGSDEEGNELKEENVDAH